MKPTPTALALLGMLALSGCVETTTDTTAVAITGGDLTGTTATNCRAAIAREMNRSIADVSVFDVVESEAGNMVRASVAGAEAPWVCRTTSSGAVLQVMFEGQG